MDAFKALKAGSDMSGDGTISFQSLSTMVTPPVNGQAAVSATKLFSTPAGSLLSFLLYTFGRGTKLGFENEQALE